MNWNLLRFFPIVFHICSLVINLPSYANLLVPGETRIEAHTDRVDIELFQVDGQWRAKTHCRAELDIRFIDPADYGDIPEEYQDARPADVVVYFPLPKDSVDIEVKEKNSPVSFKGPEPLPDDWRYWFPDYQMIYWTLPPFEKEFSTEMDVDYTHDLPLDGPGRLLLRYAFGSGNVAVIEYNVAKVRIAIPVVLSPDQIESKNELVFQHSVEVGKTILEYGEVYDYRPRDNVELSIAGLITTDVSRWEVY